MLRTRVVLTNRRTGDAGGDGELEHRDRAGPQGTWFPGPTQSPCRRCAVIWSAPPSENYTDDVCAARAGGKPAPTKSYAMAYIFESGLDHLTSTESSYGSYPRLRRLAGAKV